MTHRTWYIVLSLLSVGSIVTVLFVAAAKDADGFAVLALQLAVISFLIQIAYGVVDQLLRQHDQDAAVALRVDWARYSEESLSALRAIKEDLTRQETYLLEAAISRVPERLDLEGQSGEVAHTVIREVRELLREEQALISSGSEVAAVPEPAEAARSSLANERVQVGRQVRHVLWGEGRVVALDGEQNVIEVQFDRSDVGRRTILLEFAHLEVVG